MAWPSISLAGKIHRPGLADDDHLDLAGVLELALDLAGDLIGQLARLGVVDGVRGYDDAHLASRLDREHLLHTGEVARDLLELGEPLHVRLERCAPRLASCASSFSSAAMIPASQATSFECSRMFCP